MNRPVSGAPASRVAFRALTRTFLLRFFDNDITGGSHDLITGFFWLISFLAGPLACLPVVLMFRYHVIVVRQGTRALDLLSRQDKMLVLMLGMIASGLLAAITWNSLMLDRRDGLVLGTLPVRGRTIVLSKLAALAVYIVTIAAAIHAVSSVIFGLILAEGSGVLFLVRSPLAHFTAAVSACAFVFLAVTAVQGLSLTLWGPVLFRRISPLLQVGLVGAVIISFTKIPLLVGTVAAVRGEGTALPAWLLATPPAWFLGLYEWMLGRADPVLLSLGHTAAAALAIVTTITIATYVLTYRRVMVRIIETPETSGGSRLVTALAAALTRALARRPETRAAVQFLCASLGRVERLRFVVAMTIGIVLAFAGPAVAVLLTAPAAPSSRAIAGLSYGVQIVILLGLRVAISIPADPHASWIIPVVEAPRRALRSGVWRAIFIMGVVPVVLAFASLEVAFWGWRAALLFAAVHAAAGGLVIELLLWRFEDMPNTRLWRPENANLRLWWPAYLFGFSSFTGTAVNLEWRAGGSATATAALIAGFGMIAMMLRISHHRPHVIPPADSDDIVPSPQLLNLN